jgi:hypothetical protein
MTGLELKEKEFQKVMNYLQRQIPKWQDGDPLVNNC